MLSRLNQLAYLAEPSVVYHYTSADTLLKIVGGDPPAIWATNLQYLNDVSESKHCIDCLKSRLPDFLRENPVECADELRRAMEMLYDDGNVTGSPYVASFSTVKDSLPQWRSYCPNGNGVSIGFRVSALRESTLNFTPPMGLFLKSRLERIQYLEPSDVRIQDEILRGCIEDMEKEENDPIPGDEEGPFSRKYALVQGIYKLSSLYKHPAFQAEQEYRLIAPPLYFSGASVHFRTSRTTVVPYLKVLMPPVREFESGYASFISEVIVGPTPNAKLTVEALKQLFWSRRWVVSVTPSPIPYRDL